MDDFDHSMDICEHDWLSFFEESEQCCLLQASLACPDSSGLSDADDPDITQPYGLIKEHKAGEDCKEPGVVEDEVSIVQCFSDMNGKGVNDPKSEPTLVMKGALGGDSMTCAEKERWFVTVNDKPPQKLVPATVPVIKMKRKQKKICEVDWTHKDKANTLIDTIKPGKLSEQKCSKTNTNSLETDINTMYIKFSCKGDTLDYLDEANTSETILIKSDTNQVKSSDTTSSQEIHCESAQTQLNTDLICIGASCKESTFALQHTSEPKEIECDTCNGQTKGSKSLDTGFIQKKDRDVSSDISQTKLTMDLTCSQEHSVDYLDDSNSTKVQNSTCVDKFFQREVNVEMTTLDDSSNEGKLQNIVIEKTITNASNELDRIKQTINSSPGAFQKECSKSNNLTCFGASCKEDSLDVTLGNTVNPEVDSSKPSDNPVTSHANSIDSDEFADYETFSSSSYDSETYHSAAESTEDPRYLSMQNSPCNLTISVKDDSLTDRGMHFTNRCFKQDDDLSFTESSQIIPSAKPSADNMPNENSTALCMTVDTPTFADNSPGSLGDQLESLPQLDVTMESPEAYAKATGNTQPVYAISAFWDEMEKLTINDILQIRMGRCMLPIEEAIITGDIANTDIVESINLPECAFLDTLDTADSDYCTNLDESKPDRSSCDFSTSDFEEEYWQFINSSRNTSPDQHDKSYQSECTDYVSTGEDSDEMGTPVPSEECSGQMLCGSTVNSYNLAVPQQIKKNKSMYDIHAPKSMEDLSSQAFWDQSSCKPLEESLKVSDCFEVISPIMCLTDEQYQISFPKVCEYLFDDNNTKCEVMSVSVYGLQGDYASMTDYTYCTAPNDLALMPYIEEPIPIFSCSRPTVRELTFPKPGCIFLGTNYTTMKEVSPIQIVSKSIFRGMDCKHIDRSFSFSKDLTSLYSVKKICFLDKGPDVWREAEDEEKSVDVTDSNVTVVNEGGVLSVTPRMFKEAALWQISMEKNQMPSDYQSIFSTIKQSDMCLVCIAFASWVLRSSDPEAADAWKAALLANVSALSAIQYLRHYMKKKTTPQDE